ncbi:hypothetical protein H2204_005909, partial [Knufia peltigerae]
NKLLSTPGIQAGLVAEIKITLAENASEKYAGDKIGWTREARELLKRLLEEPQSQAMARHDHIFLAQLGQRVDALDRRLGLAPQEVASAVPAGLRAASSVVATTQSQEEFPPLTSGGSSGPVMGGRMAQGVFELETECERLRSDNQRLRHDLERANQAQGQLVAERQGQVREFNALIEARDNVIRGLNARLNDQAETIFRLVMAQYPEHERNALLARR